MKRYILKRILIGLGTILISFLLTFFLTRVVPGNPIRVLAGMDSPNPEQIAHLTARYHLDQPLGVQFFYYIKDLSHGNFGYSYKSNRLVSDIILEKISPTVILSLSAAVISVVLGTFFGVVCGRKPNNLLDRILSGICYIVDAIPGFWLAMILIMVFATKLRWFPTSGMYNIREEFKGLKRIQDLIHHMVLPVGTIVIIQVPYFFRIARSSVISTMNEDFIRIFRATGMSETLIFRKYVLRNAIIPVITAFSLSIAFILGGVTLVEVVFAWPGMGRVILDAVRARDHAVLSGVYLLLSISVTVCMLLTDFIYAWIDPRMRLE